MKLDKLESYLNSTTDYICVIKKGVKNFSLRLVNPQTDYIYFFTFDIVESDTYILQTVYEKIGYDIDKTIKLIMNY